MSLYCTIFEILKNNATLKSGSEVTQGHRRLVPLPREFTVTTCIIHQS